MNSLDRQLTRGDDWFRQPRFAGIQRLYSPRDVVDQQGALAVDYTTARAAAEGFYTLLRGLFASRLQITTFGPYSPGQAVAMKRAGIPAIYLGGWATSAKGSVDEDPGPDLASYPLSQVPNEAAAIVRALLTADRNEQFARSRNPADTTPPVDFSPFIIADADTGHGGDAHVRNLIRRFVEVGVPGYHIEDQRPGSKKCGHQAGKVLVSCDEQIKRLNAARFQLDVMRVPGIIVARTDAEAATLLDNRSDDRDQPYLLGATNLQVPSYKAGYVALLRMFAELGVADAKGHLLFALSASEYAAAERWLADAGLTRLIEETAGRVTETAGAWDAALEKLEARYSDLWQAAAGVRTYADAVADVLKDRESSGSAATMTSDEWLAYARQASIYEAAAAARAMGIEVAWDCELPKTPDGFYQVQGGIDYAIAKSLAAAPFADLLWMETKTANLEDARQYAQAIHAKYPDKMLAYNLSPSFNWDTTGMTDEQMRQFPEELGKLGFVFNFITYGGHQIDGLAGQEFARALLDDGMLALARLQRRLRLIESPYRTPQALVGGPRLDAALMAASGRTAMTKAMGKGSTHAQHLVKIEVAPDLLERWVERWTRHHGYAGRVRARLRPTPAGSDVLRLTLADGTAETNTIVTFSVIRDRRGRTILLLHDGNAAPDAMQRGLMTLVLLFLMHRYRPSAVHYMAPGEDEEAQARRLLDLGIAGRIASESGHVIVAEIDESRLAEMFREEEQTLERVIGGAADVMAAANGS